MPNAKVLSEKQAIVAALVERISNAQAGVLVDYKGITVAEDTELRTAMRKDGVEYTVVKNTLTRKALDQLSMNELDSHLNWLLPQIPSLLSVSSPSTARSLAIASTSRQPSWTARFFPTPRSLT